MVDVEHRAIKVSARFDPPTNDLEKVITTLHSIRESLAATDATVRINVTMTGKVRSIEATG